MKICIASNKDGMEAWYRKNLGEGFTFTKPALHTGMVLPIVKEERPDILILHESLPLNVPTGHSQMGGAQVSFGLLVKKVRSSFAGCRIIIIANDHKEGDQFFRAMVGMGIYDIVYGPQVNLSDSVDMIYHPRGYDYGARLQGFSDDELRSLPSEEEARVYVKKNLPNNTKGVIEKQEAYNAPQSTPAYTSVAIQTEVQKPSVPAETGDTTVLTAEQELAVMQNPVKTFSALVFEAVTTPQAVNPVSIQTQESPMMLPKKKGKMFLFTAARSGVGNTTTALNTAYHLAKSGSSVLLLDLNTDYSSVFFKIGLRNMGYGFEDLARDLETKTITDVKKLSHSREMIDRESPRYPLLPESLYFMNIVKPDNLELFYVEEAINHLLYDFDYVVVDANGILLNEYFKPFTALANRIILTVTQDLYELSEANNWVDNLEEFAPIKTKMYAAINFYEKGVSPNADEIKSYLRPLNTICIAGDRKGFIRSSTNGIIYSAQGKKKVTVSYQQIAYWLKGGDA